MPEHSPSDLVHGWQQRMESAVASAASLAAPTELSRHLLEAMHREVELVQEVVERERRLQRELAANLVAPIDAVFDLLEQSSTTLRRQSEALEAAGRALEETARQAKRQAQLFERTIDALRQPTDLAKAAAGIEQPPRKRSRGRSS